MNENNITSSSRPVVEIKLGLKDTPLYQISTDQSRTGYYTDGKFIQDGSALITDATIEGIVSQARNGSFIIKDITGIWPNRFADIGRFESSKVVGTGPDLFISYGWEGLQPDSKTPMSYTKNLTGKILSSKFDIVDDGSITIAVDYVSYTSSVYNDVIAFDWNDIIKSNPTELWDVILKNTKGKNPTAIDVMNYVLKSGSGFSYSKTLERKKIKMEFRSTATMWNAQEFSGVNELIMIEFAMPLATWLSSMLGKVILNEDSQTKSKDLGLIVTYERQPDEEKYETTEAAGGGKKQELWTTIVYDWKIIPDPESEVNKDKNIKKNYYTWASEQESMRKYNKGPVLYWKSGQAAYTYADDKAKVVALNAVNYKGDVLGTSIIHSKRVLNWESDLNNYGQIFRMFRDKLGERLNELTESDDWKKFMEAMKKVDSTDELRDIVNGKTGFWGRLGKGIVAGTYKSVVANFAPAMTLAEDMQAASEGRTAPNRDQNLASIFAQNVFKVTAEVMGDPDLGTILPGGNTIITTDFSFAGATDYTRKVYDSSKKEIEMVKESIIDMFTRQWILMETTHSFSGDGSYITKLTLIGYMPKATRPVTPDVLSRTSGHGIQQ